MVIINNINRNKIHQEFVDAGIDVVSVFALDESGLGADITFGDDVDMVLVQAIIDSHNPLPLPKPLSEVEKLKIENAQANAELFEMMLMLTGGLS